MGENAKTLEISSGDKGQWSFNLKTIEVDTDKKIFKVNGIPFGEMCESFSIYHDYFETILRIEKSIYGEHKNAAGESSTTANI